MNPERDRTEGAQHGSAARGADRPADRRVRDDATGVVWAVRERDCAGEPGTRAPRCLCFVCEAAVRRVWCYPADWAALPDPALLGLMGGRIALPADPRRELPRDPPPDLRRGDPG